MKSYPALPSLTLLAICAIVLAVALPSGHATVLRKLSLEDLTAHADIIAVGRCQATETLWKQRKIYTVATIEVDQGIKGNAAPGLKLVVYALGGRVKKPMPVKMHVPGAAKVAPGQEMVLFLKSFGDKKQYYRFVGMHQGKIPVKTDKETGRKHIVRVSTTPGVKMVDGEGKPVPEDEASSRLRESRLEDYLGRLKRTVDDQKARARKAAEQEAPDRQAEHVERGSEK